MNKDESCLKKGLRGACLKFGQGDSLYHTLPCTRHMDLSRANHDFLFGVSLTPPPRTLYPRLLSLSSPGWRGALSWVGVESRSWLSCLSILSPGLEKCCRNDICRAAGFPPPVQDSAGKLGLCCCSSSFSSYLLSCLWLNGEPHALLAPGSLGGCGPYSLLCARALLLIHVGAQWVVCECTCEYVTMWGTHVQR